MGSRPCDLGLCEKAGAGLASQRALLLRWPGGADLVCWRSDQPCVSVTLPTRVKLLVTEQGLTPGDAGCQAPCYWAFLSLGSQRCLQISSSSGSGLVVIQVPYYPDNLRCPPTESTTFYLRAQVI